MTTAKKQTAGNNVFLQNCKKLFNVPTYKHVMSLTNGEGGEASAREYLLKHVVRSLPF